MQTKNNTPGFIPPHGGYRNLKSYQKAEIVYDGTVYFCTKYFKKYDRTIDQMVQAARSGKQNIVEASMASGTSKEMEIKLTGVARASLEELLNDYQDFLRTRKLNAWTKDSEQVTNLRKLNSIPDATYETFRSGIENTSPETSANVLIGLIKVTTFLLDRQLRSLESAFITDGGLRERMTQARISTRKTNQSL